MADDEVEIEVAADTGAGAHCVHPRHLPDSVEVMTDKTRTPNEAAGEPLTHYGRATVGMQQGDGSHIEQEVQVDVRGPSGEARRSGDKWGALELRKNSFLSRLGTLLEVTRPAEQRPHYLLLLYLLPPFSLIMMY